MSYPPQPIPDGYQQPYYQQPLEVPTAPPAAPKSVSAAVLMVYILAGLSLCSSLLGLSNVDFTQAESVGRFTSNISISVVGAGIAIAAAIFTSKGYNWARIVLIVLRSLSLAAALFGIVLGGIVMALIASIGSQTDASAQVGKAMGVVGLLLIPILLIVLASIALDITIIVLLARKSSSEFFEQSARWREYSTQGTLYGVPAPGQYPPNTPNLN